MESEEESAAKNAAIMIANVIRVICCLFTLGMCCLKIKYRDVLKNTAISVVRDIIQVILSILPLIILADMRAKIPDDILSSETDVNYHGISQS